MRGSPFASPASTAIFVARLLAVLMATFMLSACGGGGGSSGGAAATSDAKPVRGGQIVGNPSTLKAGHAYTIRFNKLEGPNEIIVHTREEAWIHPDDPLSDSLYIELEQVGELELRFVVPYGLNAGRHDMTVILGGLDVFSFDLNIVSPDLVDFEIAELYLQDYINDALLELDNLIASLQSDNVGASQLAPLIDARNTLADVVLSDLDLEQINYLYLLVQQQQLLLAEQAIARASYNETFCSDLSRTRLKEIGRVALGAGMISTAVYGASVAPVLSGALAAIGGATLYVTAKKLMDEFPAYWDSCVYPTHAELVPDLFRSRSAISRSSSPSIEYPDEIELNPWLDSQYQLNRKLGVAEALRLDFISFMNAIEDIAESYPFLVPQSVQDQISAYTDPQGVTADSDALSILSISTPEVQGTVTVIDDITFSLSFSATSAFYNQSDNGQFEFTLYDAEYDQNIDFVANMGTKHCPSYYTSPSDTISIEESDDSCVVTVTYSLNNPSNYEVSEFVYGKKRNFDKFQSGLTVYSEGYWHTGNLASVVNYYPLKQNNDGSYANLTESIYHYFESGLIHREEQYLEPFMSKGKWYTHSKTLIAYDELSPSDHGEVYTEYLWSDPLLNDDGSYAVCEDSSTHWSYGYYTAYDYQYEFDEEAGYWRPAEGDLYNSCAYFPAPY